MYFINSRVTTHHAKSLRKKIYVCPLSLRKQLWSFRCTAGVTTSCSKVLYTLVHSLVYGVSRLQPRQNTGGTTIWKSICYSMAANFAFGLGACTANHLSTSSVQSPTFFVVLELWAASGACPGTIRHTWSSIYLQCCCTRTHLRINNSRWLGPLRSSSEGQPLEETVLSRNFYRLCSYMEERHAKILLVHETCWC